MSEDDKKYLDGKFSDLAKELTAYVAKRTEALTAYVDERAEKVETKLLSAFHGWARSMEIRTRVASSQVSGMDERLALAEERISELERHKAS
jgi:hypothetical protein